MHQRGFEPVQQEQMVLQYVEKHGESAVGEVAEALPVEPTPSLQITDLKNMKRFGKYPVRPKGVRYGSARK